MQFLLSYVFSAYVMRTTDIPFPLNKHKEVYPFKSFDDR